MQHDHASQRIERRRFIQAATLVATAAIVRPSGACTTTTERFRFKQVHMGAPWELVLYAADQKAANSASNAAFARIAALDACLSDYQADSELSRLNTTAGTGKAVSVGDDLWQVVSAAHDLSTATDGAFDITVGPLVRLWRRARRYKELPKPELLAEARQAVGYQLLKLDAAQKTIELTRPDMRLDPGGIAMGYAADEALKVLKQHGVTRAMVDASGDVVCGDAPPDRPGWIIGIAPEGGKNGKPTRYLSLANASVTTSGDAYQFVELNGVRYSHIVDPRTGMGLTNRATVSIVAPDGITADSVATAVNVLGPDRGAKYIERRADLAGHFTWLVDDRVETRETTRLRSYIVTP
jgi:thiamine biosynthesis lipoprotein